jgi:hypothetical protein
MQPCTVTIYALCATSATAIQGEPPGYFAHVSMTTPVVPALKNYYIESLLVLEAPTNFLNHFWIQITVPRFATETVDPDLVLKIRWNF